MLHPLIARLSTETAAFFCFSASSSAACSFLDAFRHSLLLLVAVVFTVVCLSVIRCRPSRPFICSLLLLPPSPYRLLRLPVAVVGFLVVSLFGHRPLVHSLQLVFAIVGLALGYFSFSSPMSTRCRPRSPAGEL